jgi:L-histidine N-alpha-methyltransferase
MAGGNQEPPVIAVGTASYHETVADMAADSARRTAPALDEVANGVRETRSTEDSLEFARSVAEGLEDSPRWLDCRYLYDSAGSHIFERICEQPEYYLTRTEGSILAAVGLDIALRTGSVRLVELGSGSSIKTRLLLDAYCELYGSACYTPVDISCSILDHAREELAASRPEVDVEPLNSTYEKAFPLLGDYSPVLLLFLGSTLGNLNEEESLDFWEEAAAGISPGDYCLLGLDINEDVDSINAAYNDAAGWSRAFTRNLFERMNRELGSSLDTEAIEHVARFNRQRSRVEIFARFERAQTIAVEPLGRRFEIGAGEQVLTEISCKFRLEEMVPYLADFGLTTEQVYTDSAGRFAVLLLRRV